MSLFAVEQVLWNVNFKPEVAAQFQQAPDEVLKQYPLDDAEADLIRRFDVRALADAGASQMLVMMTFQTLNGGMQAMPDYMRRMNTPAAPAAA